MGAVMIYMVKVAVYLAAFYLVYALFLSRDTSYGRNRIFLLLSLIFSIIFPLINFQTGKPLEIQVFGKLLSEVFIIADAGDQTVTENVLNINLPVQLIFSLYIIGAAILLVKLSIEIISLILLIIRKKSAGSKIIRYEGFSTAGFSAMGYIFINQRLSPEEAGEIIRHEKNHKRHNHYIDIILIELLSAIQWFNPFIFLFNRELRAIHEFQADQECLDSGIPVVNYQSLLMNQIFKTRSVKLSNSFSNPSLLKKRMLMMTKKRTSALAGIKLLLVIPVTLLVFLAISAYHEIPVQQNTLSIEEQVNIIPDEQVNTIPDAQVNTIPETRVKTISEAQLNTIPEPPPPPPPPSSNPSLPEREKTEIVKEETTNPEEVPFVVAEEMPLFKGGEAALLAYIGQNTIYPEAAKENNIQGKVIIRFCVTAKGGISQISVLKGVSPELDAEAIRVVKTLPAFTPGRQGGKPIPVWYMVPITFALK